MKRSLLIIAIVLISIILFLLTYDFKSEQEQFFSVYTLTQEELDKIHDGDIILRHGYGLVSDLIVKSLQEKYDISHCAIVKKDSVTGIIEIIHSVSKSLSPYDGVQSQNIKSFIKNSQENSIIVVRFKSPNGNDQSLISKKAQYYLKKRIPFDHAFNIEDSLELYCSESLWKIILDEYQIDIFKDKYNEQKGHMNFSNFWNDVYFEIIFNHQIKKTNY